MNYALHNENKVEVNPASFANQLNNYFARHT